MITLLPHDPIWSNHFNEEKDALLGLNIDTIIRIEHIGSTAILGIYAKPVIDILIGVKNLEQFTLDDIKKIETLGYVYNPTFEIILPNRRYFQKDNQQGIRTHQIHLVSYPSPWYERHILFRDLLRSNPDIAKDYEALKLSLAKIYDDTVDYAQAKNDFCREIDKLAFNDFTINKPFIKTKRLAAFIPQLACHSEYSAMVTNSKFTKCYGYSYDATQALMRLESDMEHYNQYGFGPWMWYDSETHNYVGRGGLKSFELNGKSEIELSYQVKTEYWNRGLAREIGQAALKYAARLHMEEVICFTTEANLQSLRVIDKLGFLFEGYFYHLGIKHKLFRYKVAKK